MQAKKSSSYPKQSVFVPSIPSSMAIAWEKYSKSNVTF